MHTFSQKSKTVGPVAFVRPNLLNRTPMEQSRGLPPGLKGQSTTQNQAVPRLPGRGPSGPAEASRFGHDFSQVPAHTNGLAGQGRGPRKDGLEDAPYRGPGEAAVGGQRGPGKGKGMGCVIGPMHLVTSGKLEGGYTVDDYLSGGLSWGNVSSPGSAGADGRGFKVQLYAAYSNDQSLGVSQTMTHGGSNQSFLDGTASYLGKAAGSVKNGDTFSEPVLKAGDPYAHTGWELQYGPKSGKGNASLLSFADVPRAGAGDKGYINFNTCFYSRGGPCQEDKVCRTWRWTVDFTGSNKTNTVK